MRPSNSFLLDTQSDPINLKAILTRATLLPLLLACLLAGLFLWQIDRLLEAARWVDRTDSVIARANGALKSVVDMETGLRGFLITSEEDFLEPYNRGNLVIDPTLESLSGLVSDNPLQLRRIGEGRSQLEKWRAYCRDKIDLRERDRDFHGRGTGGEGKTYTDELL